MGNKDKVIIIENNKIHFNTIRNFLMPCFETNGWEEIQELILHTNQFCSNNTTTKSINLKEVSKRYLNDFFQMHNDSLCFILDYQINEESGKSHVNIDSVIELMKSKSIANFLVLSGKMDPDKRNDYRSKGILILEKIENWNETQLPTRQEKMKQALLKAISEFPKRLSDEEVLKEKIIKKLNVIRPKLGSSSTTVSRNIAELVKDLLGKIDRNEIILNEDMLDLLNQKENYLENLTNMNS